MIARRFFSSLWLWMLLYAYAADPILLMAQEGKNKDAVFVLDFLTTAADTQSKSTIDVSPVFTGTTPKRFSATLVLKNASALTGVNCDLIFDPKVIKVVDIHESQGDVNFDGRGNIADILAIGERYGQKSSENGNAFFNRDVSGESAEKIDYKDIDAVLPYLSKTDVFWTSNPNYDLRNIRESVEIFESPDISNSKGRIDDIVVTLLSRIHPTPAGFGFNGDARIADITFELVGTPGGTTVIRFEDTMAIDEATEITATDIKNFSRPAAPDVIITLP